MPNFSLLFYKLWHFHRLHSKTHQTHSIAKDFSYQYERNNQLLEYIYSIKKCLKIIFSSWTWRHNSPFYTSISVLLVTKNGLLRKIGVSLSFSMPNTMKSTGNINLSILTRTSSIDPLRFASCNVTVVGCASSKSSFLKIDKGIKLILAPKSNSALSNVTFLIDYGIVKLTGSLSLEGNFLYKIELHSLVSMTIS